MTPCEDGVTGHGRTRPWDGWLPHRNGATLGLDLAIADLQAREQRGVEGSLGIMEVISEAPTSGVRLRSRRASVRQAGAAHGRLKVADPLDLRLPFRTIDRRAGSPAVPRST